MPTRTIPFRFLLFLAFALGTAYAGEKAHLYMRLLQESNALEARGHTLIGQLGELSDRGCGECRKVYQDISDSWSSLQKELQEQIYAANESRNAQDAGIKTYRGAIVREKEFNERMIQLLNQKSNTLCGKNCIGVPDATSPSPAGSAHPADSASGARERGGGSSSTSLPEQSFSESNTNSDNAESDLSNEENLPATIQIEPSYENEVLYALRVYATAQVTFSVSRQGRDAKNSGSGDNGYADNFRNLFYGKVYGEEQNFGCITRSMADAFAGPTAGVETVASQEEPAAVAAPWNGYLFLEPPGIDFSRNFCLVAYPVSFKKAHTKIFLIDDHGILFEMDVDAREGGCPLEDEMPALLSASELPGANPGLWRMVNPSRKDTPEKPRDDTHTSVRTPVDRSYSHATRFNLAYSIRDSAALPRKKVSFYITEDMGNTWRFYREDPDCESPMTIEIPAEGTYGFFCQVTDRFGNVEPEPAPGANPQSVVVVDRTPPTANWLSQSQNSFLGKNHGQDMELSWAVTDPNLGTHPVTIQYASDARNNFDREASWTMLHEKLAASGSVFWSPPAEGTYFFRLVGEDLAGNVTIAYNPAAVIFDTTPPRVTAVFPHSSNQLENEIIVGAVDDRGSGVKDVFLYVSDNAGDFWQILRETNEMGESVQVRRPPGAPIVFTVPHSGIYALWPVVTDKCGNVSPLPQAGVPGSYTLRVDTEEFPNGTSADKLDEIRHDERAATEIMERESPGSGLNRRYRQEPLTQWATDTYRPIVQFLGRVAAAKSFIDVEKIARESGFVAMDERAGLLTATRLAALWDGVRIAQNDPQHYLLSPIREILDNEFFPRGILSAERFEAERGRAIQIQRGESFHTAAVGGEYGPISIGQLPELLHDRFRRKLSPFFSDDFKKNLAYMLSNRMSPNLIYDGDETDKEPDSTVRADIGEEEQNQHHRTRDPQTEEELLQKILSYDERLRLDEPDRQAFDQIMMAFRKTVASDKPAYSFGLFEPGFAIINRANGTEISQIKQMQHMELHLRLSNLRKTRFKSAMEQAALHCDSGEYLMARQLYREALAIPEFSDDQEALQLLSDVERHIGTTTDAPIHSPSDTRIDQPEAMLRELLYRSKIK